MSQATPPVRPLPRCRFEGAIENIQMKPDYQHPCLSFWERFIYDCPHGPELRLPERYEISLLVQEISFVSGDARFETCGTLYPVGSQQLLLLERARAFNTDGLTRGGTLSGVVTPPAPYLKWILSHEARSRSPGDRSATIDTARDRAEECLVHLRKKRWGIAADCMVAEWRDTSGWHQVPLDGPAHPRLEQLRKEAVNRLMGLYGDRPPGSVSSVNFRSYEHLDDAYRKPGKRVMVSYRHGDVDGFEMIFLKGNWYRVVDF